MSETSEKPMTPDLPAIRQRAEQALGTARVRVLCGGCGFTYQLCMGCRKGTFGIHAAPRNAQCKGHDAETPCANDCVVAHARQDVLDLVAYIETLTTERDALAKSLDHYVSDLTALRASLSALVETWRKEAAYQPEPTIGVMGDSAVRTTRRNSLKACADQLALLLTGEK